MQGGRGRDTLRDGVYPPKATKRKGRSMGLTRLRPERIIGAVCVLALLGCAVAGEEEPSLRFARVFGDHMVLQQGKPLRVWGWARPAAQVAVSITEDAKVAKPFLEEVKQPAEEPKHEVRMGYVEVNALRFRPQQRTTKADGEGAWEVAFDPVAASFTPKFIVARSGDEGAAIGDVVVGEVWVCTGQSNMVMGNWCAKDIEAPGADFPGIRYFRVDASYYKPLEDLEGRPRWVVCSPEAAVRFSAVPCIFARFMHLYLKVPVGVINNARGGTLAMTWCSRGELEAIDFKPVQDILRAYDAETTKWEKAEERERIMKEWETRCGEARARWEKEAAKARKEGREPRRLRLPRRPGDPRRGWSPPAGMFNAVVWPIRRLAVRGVLYYQGENNQFGRWTQYEYTFPRVIASWRKAFGEPELPFGIITLPGWGNYEEEPEVACVADGYAIIRDIHTRTHERTPNTGLITTYDVGNSYIHPAWKRPVGERAARWALVKVYGKTDLRYRGPKLREVKKEGNKLLLYFSPDPLIERSRKEGKELPWWAAVPVTRQGSADYRGFVIAGSDRRWYPAKARLNKGKQCLDVWSPLVEDPVAVRYGWAQWPRGNLCGNHNLPVPTFRTDDWPIPEMFGHEPELRKRCEERIRELRKAAELQALDRKLREALMSLGEVERQLFMGRYQRDPAKLLESKARRIAMTLDEMESESVKRLYDKDNPVVARKIKAVRSALGELEAELDKLPASQ